MQVILMLANVTTYTGGRRGRDCMVVVFITYAISTYHH
jgi:hypothetical protein